MAGNRLEIATAATCILALVAIFLADVLTPADVVVTGLLVFPLLVAAWSLGARTALAVVGAALVLMVLEAVLGAVNDVTVAVEVISYMVLAVLVRSYARRVDQVPQPGNEPSLGPRIDLLTRREREVVALAAHGRTASEIADLLHIGERTVETHLANAYPKLGVRSKLELVKQAHSLGV